MDFIATPLGVLLLVGLVAVAAVSFEPQSYLRVIRWLARDYETQGRPRSVLFPGQDVLVGDIIGDYTRFDVAVDDAGLWLLYNGPSPPKAPDCLLIPWDCIRFGEDRDDGVMFELKAKRPIDIALPRDVAAAVLRRLERSPDNPLAN